MITSREYADLNKAVDRILDKFYRGIDFDRALLQVSIHERLDLAQDQIMALHPDLEVEIKGWHINEAGVPVCTVRVVYPTVDSDRTTDQSEQEREE
jgi:hypothetical protein